MVALATRQKNQVLANNVVMPQICMPYLAISSRKTSSARMSASPVTMALAWPSIAVARTGWSCGSRHCGGTVVGVTQIPLHRNWLNNNRAWLGSIRFFKRGRCHTRSSSLSNGSLIMTRNRSARQASKTGSVACPASKVRIHIFVSTTILCMIGYLLSRRTASISD